MPGLDVSYKMKITKHLLIAAILLSGSGCDENENKNEAVAEWPSFWTSEPGHDTWPYQYSSYRKYEIESTYSEASLKNYLNVYDNKISFQAYDSSTHFLALQVMIYSKKKKQAMQLCSLSHITSVQLKVVECQLIRNQDMVILSREICK